MDCQFYGAQLPDSVAISYRRRYRLMKIPVFRKKISQKSG